MKVKIDKEPNQFGWLGKIAKKGMIDVVTCSDEDLFPKNPKEKNDVMDYFKFELILRNSFCKTALGYLTNLPDCSMKEQKKA